MNDWTLGSTAQLDDATEEVKAMLAGSKVSVKEIQDALWHYYFDVNKTVVYLIGKGNIADYDELRLRSQQDF